MRAIHKYRLETTGFQKVALPLGAKILCVQLQMGAACLWAEVDMEAATEEVIIHIYGTGHTLPEIAMEYIGTYQLRGGSLVFHVYQESWPCQSA